MTQTVFILAFIIIATLLIVASGIWRLIFRPFGIRAGAMTVRRLGLHVDSPEDIERVDTVLRSFAGGFNRMIASPSSGAWRRYCNTLPILFQPFAQEGGAMGYTLRNLFRFDARRFEDEVVKPLPEFRYLYYVGLGFWWGMRNVTPSRVMQMVEGLDPLHRYLCFDGYGFKVAFFDAPKNPDAPSRLNGFEGYARNAAYQGVGRALFFRYLSRPDLLVEQIEALGQNASDAAAGVGLASVFVFPDRIDVARKLAAHMPDSWHAPFHLGMCFALKARAINNVDQFEKDMLRLDADVRDSALASVRECDRIELETRSDGQPDGYRRWRQRVASWMTDHIEYPLGGLTRGTPALKPNPAHQARL